MSLFKMVNGVSVQLTPQEESDQLAEWAANQAASAALASSYINIRALAIKALGDYAIYTATNGAGSYEAAVAAIITANPVPIANSA